MCVKHIALGGQKPIPWSPVVYVPVQYILVSKLTAILRSVGFFDCDCAEELSTDGCKRPSGTAVPDIR